VKNSTPASLPLQKESGIGLENLRRRLALLYPNQHEFKTTKQGDEFQASLLIKLKPHEN
jgi:two-component system LytT family sensor kinase